jgi:hypothetical protein
MENIKGIEELTKQLSGFEEDITVSIGAELGRIGRTVNMDELAYIPFNDDVRNYVEAIRLDGDNNPVLDTSFQDVHEKELLSCIADNEIDHWNLVGLLELLKDIEK